MGALFKKPKMPKPLPRQDVPEPDVEAETQKELERLKKQRGRTATILTRGVMGDDSASSSGLATRKLLGG